MEGRKWWMMKGMKGGIADPALKRGSSLILGSANRQCSELSDILPCTAIFIHLVVTSVSNRLSIHTTAGCELPGRFLEG